MLSKHFIFRVKNDILMVMKNTPEKVEKVAMTSGDVENENLQKLRSVFPSFVKDGVIDFDAFQAFFKKEGILAGVEKYGLSWAGKSKAFGDIRRPATSTLTPQSKESKNWDTTENIFIEGENLEVLKLLQKKYANPGKIKMIYIDPPYNTGKDFIYTDNFTENKNDYYERTGQNCGGIKLTSNPESNGRYHSDWLTMMYPRLFLARNILRDDGVIFVSIDDHEVTNLRMIMDEIFGEENFVACITVVGNPRGRDYGGVAKMHDYLLVYLRSDESLINNLNEPNKEFPFKDESGDFEIRELRNRNIAFNSDNRPNLYYPFYINTNKKDKNGFYEISLDKHAGWTELYPKESQGYKTVWRWGKPKSLENLNTEIVGKAMEDGGFQVIEKYRETSRMARSVWSDKEDNTEKGTLLIKSLFESKVFDFPKPMEMIRKIVEMGSSKDSSDLILDFFAGSGTTAHAVMDLNAEDGGNRKWICIQVPEGTGDDSEACKAGYKTISQLSMERIRRAGAKIGKGDVGFKAFSLSPSNYSEWNVLTDKDDEKTLLQQAKLFAEQPLVAGYDEKSVVYEILLKEGYELNSKIADVKKGGVDCYHITDGDKEMTITFASKLTKEQVDGLELPKDTTFVCLDSALDDTTKVNIARNLTVKTI